MPSLSAMLKRATVGRLTMLGEYDTLKCPGIHVMQKILVGQKTSGNDARSNLSRAMIGLRIDLVRSKWEREST